MGATCSSAEPHEHDARRRLSERFGEEFADSLSHLASVLKHANDTVVKKPLKHPALVNLGMIMAQCKAEERYARPLEAGKNFADMALLMRAARYARYARAACCSHRDEIAKVIQDEDDFGGNTEILHVHAPSGMLGLATGRSSQSFFIATDKVTGDIVLTIRGKATPQEALAAFHAETAPVLEGTTLKELRTDCVELIQQVKEPLEAALAGAPESSLVVVGHGMGAGLAVLAVLQAFGEGSVVESLFADGKVRCFAFAPLPLFEPVGTLLMHRTSATYSFVNGMDLVARTSPATVGKLLFAIRKVDEMPLELATRLDFLNGDPKGEGSAEIHQALPDYAEIPAEFSTDFASLSWVGNTIVFHEGSDGRMNCRKLGGTGVDRILLHPDMANDYALAGYEKSIAEVLMQLQKDKGCC